MGRFKRVRVVLALAVVATGLVVVNSGASATVVQNGTNNYSGPRSCNPADADNAHETYGVTFDDCKNEADVEQHAGGGKNVFEAFPVGGKAKQFNTSGPNTFVCAVSTTADVSIQACEAVLQDGDGGNTVTADMQATPSRIGQISNVTMDAIQTLKVTQTSANGPNSVVGTQNIDQTANSLDPISVGAAITIAHQLETLALAQVSQVASGGGNNSTNLTLTRKQMSIARGISPTQTEDVRLNADDPNGKALIFQRTATGTNYTKVRGVDDKYAEARAYIGSATQRQWHAGGGWKIEADVDSSGNPGGGTVDFGTPFASGADCRTQVDGIKKLGVIKTFDTFNNPTDAGVQEQIDGLPIRLPGTSPQDGTIAGCTDLQGGGDTKQETHVSVDGHADGAIVGAIAAKLTSGGTSYDYVPFNAQTVHVSIDCMRNTPNTCSQTGGGVTGSGTDVSATQYVPFNAQVAEFTNANPDKPVAYAKINWGDATPVSDGVIGGSGSPYTVTGSHRYETAGSKTIETILYYGDNSEAARMSSTATVAPLTYSFPNGGSFVVGDAAGGGDIDVGDVVTFWWDQWNTVNPFKSGKVAPSSFKGWENTLTNPTCGDPNAPAPGFAAVGGNSAPPPAGTLPQLMGVIIASEVKSAKNTPTGKVWGIAIVDTTGTGYGPNPASQGQGTVVGIVCTRG